MGGGQTGSRSGRHAGGKGTGCRAWLVFSIKLGCSSRPIICRIYCLSMQNYLQARLCNLLMISGAQMKTRRANKNIPLMEASKWQAMPHHCTGNATPLYRVHRADVHWPAEIRKLNCFWGADGVHALQQQGAACSHSRNKLVKTERERSCSGGSTAHSAGAYEDREVRRACWWYKTGQGPCRAVWKTHMCWQCCWRTITTPSFRGKQTVHAGQSASKNKNRQCMPACLPCTPKKTQ